ncbi:Uncharacterized protein SCG7086_CQ_00030 [Chlamydiales bacterium SCGC AG-110-P3]|nr:Uncharacterized protein SCG7086_CQ_00030 [Chlamydiales bacterium SCGC AG-110-P3]
MTVLMRLLLSCTTFAFILVGCQRYPTEIEPRIYYTPQAVEVRALPSPFPSLSVDERNSEWGRELLIARSFTSELDLYRAITGFKRTLVLLPPALSQRRMQVQYSIVLAYYLGRKYHDVVSEVQGSLLLDANTGFPAFDQLLIILEDSYRYIGECDKADRLLEIIESGDPDTANDLRLGDAIHAAAFDCIDLYKDEACSADIVDEMLYCYCSQKKSVETAQLLSLFPGAGYLYVGQSKAAVTSFLINTLFIVAAIRFFDQGNPAAGIIAAGFEAGWYFGGINGASGAAREYNERIYECHAKDAMVQGQLFPVLMFTTGF